MPRSGSPDPPRDIAVRVLGPGDASVLFAVAPGVFDEPVRPDTAEEFLRDPRHAMVVAELAGVVVGFVSAVEYIHPDKPPQLWINEVGVAPEFRRRGIATRLLHEMVRHATDDRRVRDIWLATETDNAPARALYRSLGWRETPIVAYEAPGSRLLAGDHSVDAAS